MHRFMLAIHHTDDDAQHDVHLVSSIVFIEHTQFSKRPAFLNTPPILHAFTAFINQKLLVSLPEIVMVKLHVSQLYV